MPPRKRARTDHVQDGSANRTARASTDSKAITAATNDVPNSRLGTSVARSVVKLRRGCLKEIPNFALEIQLMIFENLHPQDLLNLSRTSKTFHDFFLHRSNESLWVAAMKNAEDLPERPPWMSIPRFIHLLYSPHCHNCGCPNIRKVIWPWFARYCSSCLQEITCSETEADCLLREVDCLTSAHFLLHSVCFKGTNFHWRSPHRYLKLQVDELSSRWAALPQPVELATLDNFALQCVRDLTTRVEYFVPCEKWYKELENARVDSRRSGRAERFDAILDRLKETGWEKDLHFLGEKGLDQMSRLPVVRQSKKLTDKEWQKVQTALHEFLSDTRTARLKQEREALLRERFAELDKAIIAHYVTIPRNATMECRPVGLDLALQAELEPVANAPSTETITQETFAAIVPQLVTSWEAEQRQFLQSYLRQFIRTLPPQGVDILDLAIAVVYTGSSAYQNVRTMRYPYILAQGFRHSEPRSECDDFPPSHYAAAAAASSKDRPYSLKSLKPKQVEAGIKWMRSIVAKLGLKPDTATFSDLEQCGARLRCLKCAEEGEGHMHAYTWEAAFSHTAEHDTAQSDKAYPRSSHVRWARVDEADMAKVKEREAVAHTLTADSECQWSCTLCVDWKGWGGEEKPANRAQPVPRIRKDPIASGRIREHLASEHNITDMNGAIEDGTIFWSPLHNDLRKPAVEL